MVLIKKTKASDNCWSEPRCKTGRRSSASVIHATCYIHHPHFKALFIKVTLLPAFAVDEIAPLILGCVEHAYSTSTAEHTIGLKKDKKVK